ncbi:hypothetical protein [Pedobacter sp.]|uniref:hypothetical protein n=1 Tax=Pedobacter sp. TaxID=1411316 RepID=UPI003C4C68EB
MQTIADRTRSLIELSGMNEYSFSKRIGKSNTAITKLVKGESKPGFEMIESIFNEFPNLSREWYLEGTGEMWKTETPSAPPVESYLKEHLLRLETNFALLSDQLKAQLESKDKQIEGLQRTVDALLGPMKEKSFIEPVPEAGRILKFYPVNGRKKFA